MSRSRGQAGVEYAWLIGIVVLAVIFGLWGGGPRGESLPILLGQALETLFESWALLLSLPIL